MMVVFNDDSNMRQPAPKEWRPPELHKLRIEATSSSGQKGGLNNAQNVGGPKNADAGSQIS